MANFIRAFFHHKTTVYSGKCLANQKTLRGHVIKLHPPEQSDDDVIDTTANFCLNSRFSSRRRFIFSFLSTLLLLLLLPTSFNDNFSRRLSISRSSFCTYVRVRFMFSQYSSVQFERCCLRDFLEIYK